MEHIKKGDLIEPSLAHEPVCFWFIPNANGLRYPFYTYAKLINKTYEAATDSSFSNTEYKVKVFIDKKPELGQKLQVEKVKNGILLAKVV